MTSSACAKARAEMVADGPPLEVPAAPPRVIAAIDDRLAATPQPVDPPTNPAQRTPAAPQGRRPVSPPAEGEGREPAATPAPAAAATPAPVPEAPRDLRPAGSADAEAEKKARSLVGQALQILSRIDSRTFSTDNKAQFEEARRFVERAEQEIKDRNFVFAETFADKAVTLATQLLGR